MPNYKGKIREYEPASEDWSVTVYVEQLEFFLMAIAVVQHHESRQEASNVFVHDIFDFCGNPKLDENVIHA